MAEFWSEPLTRDNLPEFFNEFAGAAYSYIYSMTGDEAASEKKVEEAFDRIYRQRKHIQPNRLVFALGAELDKVCGAADGAAPEYEAIAPDVSCMARMMNKVLHNADSLAGVWGVGGDGQPENTQPETPENDESGEELPESGEEPPKDKQKSRKAIGILLIVLLALLAGAVVFAAATGRLPIQLGKTTASSASSAETTVPTEPLTLTTAETSPLTEVLTTPEETTEDTPVRTTVTTPTGIVITRTTAETAPVTEPPEPTDDPDDDPEDTPSDTVMDGHKIKGVTAEGTVKVGAALTLTVRKGPAKTYAAVGDVKDGEKVTITGSSEGWYRIEYKGGSGFIYSGYVTGYKETGNKGKKTTKATEKTTKAAEKTTKATKETKPAEPTPTLPPEETDDPVSPAPDKLNKKVRAVYDATLQAGIPLAYDEKEGSYRLAGTVFSWDAETMTEPEEGANTGLAQFFNQSGDTRFTVYYHEETGTVTSGSGKYYTPEGKIFPTQPKTEDLPEISGLYLLTTVSKSGTTYYFTYTHTVTGRRLTYSTETDLFTDAETGEPFELPAVDPDMPDDRGTAAFQPRYTENGDLYWKNTVDGVCFKAGLKSGEWITTDGDPYTLKLPEGVA